MPRKTHSLVKFGQTIKRYRLSLEMSQEEFATKVGLHRTYIGAIERGEQNVTLITLMHLAKGLKLKVVNLCEEL
jgi:transcriptional regulator with XRE-family HTH domain